MAPWVKDSKKYSKREQRQKVVDYLRGLENAYWCLQWVDPSEIDERGLDFCHREALRASVDVMYHMMNNDNPGYPERIIIDGAWGDLYPGAECVEQAEDKFSQVAAASVLAKSARDEHMGNLESTALGKGYGFGKHAGYGAEEHKRALEKLGVSVHHRHSFAPVAKLIREGKIVEGLESRAPKTKKLLVRVEQ
mgnify:CR=1 FL=1